MPAALVTGANRGLGLEFATQYARDGWQVVATCRRAEDLPALEALADVGDVRSFELDVADFDEIDALAGELADESLDVLLNNAGLFGPKAGADKDLR